LFCHSANGPHWNATTLIDIEYLGRFRLAAPFVYANEFFEEKSSHKDTPLIAKSQVSAAIKISPELLTFCFKP
jgi:hypothetical protein